MGELVGDEVVGEHVDGGLVVQSGQRSMVNPEHIEAIWVEKILINAS